MKAPKRAASRSHRADGPSGARTSRTWELVPSSEDESQSIIRMLSEYSASRHYLMRRKSYIEAQYRRAVVSFIVAVTVSGALLITGAVFTLLTGLSSASSYTAVGVAAFALCAIVPTYVLFRQVTRRRELMLRNELLQAQVAVEQYRRLRANLTNVEDRKSA